MASVSVPTVLYHYTGPQGLLGIIRNASLWASNIHYLNDSKELHQAAECAQQVMYNMTDYLDVAAREQLRGRLRDHLERISKVSIMVASLSEDGDSLSQWRAYCPSGGGYSVGLEHGLLGNFAARQGFALRSCSYSLREHTELVRPLVQKVVDAKPSIQEEEFSRFLSDFVQVAPIMKNPSFAEEREWRLVSGLFSTDRSDWQVRATNRMLVPYTEFSIGRGEESSISDVVIGPTPDPELAMDSLSSALRSTGHRRWQTRFSSTSFRDW